MGEPLAAAANHFTRNVHSKHLVEVAGQRFEEAPCATANLENALMSRENFRHAFQHQPHVPLARGSEGGLVLRIIAGDGLMSILSGPHIPIALHVEAAHGKVTPQRHSKKGVVKRCWARQIESKIERTMAQNKTPEAVYQRTY